MDESHRRAVDPRALEKEDRTGARSRFFLLRPGHWPVPNQFVPATWSVVPGHALCEDKRAKLRRIGIAAPGKENRRVAPRHRARGRFNRLWQINHPGGDD